VGPNLLQALNDLCCRHHFETLDPKQLHFYIGSKINDPDRQADYQYSMQQCKEYHKTKRNEYFQLLQKAESYWAKPASSVQRVWTQVNDERAGGRLILGLGEGFEEAGLQTRLLCFQDRLFTRLYRCAYDFFAFLPDLVLSLNHSSDYIGSFAKNIPIPRIVWYVDHPYRTVDIPYNPYDKIIAVSDAFQPEIQNRGGSYLGEIPAACFTELQKPPLSPTWKHDVSYVGSVVDSSTLLASCSPKTLQWIDNVIAFQLENPGLLMEDIVAQKKPAEDISRELREKLPGFFTKAAYMTGEQLINYFLYTEANTRRRIQYLASLSSIGSLGIYGQQDWLALLPEHLRSCYQGEISSTQVLMELYQTSKVNLSINSLQGFSFVNPRLFDVPAAGGYLLAEYVPGLETYFNRENELDWFYSDDDLVERIQAALRDDGERLAMIARVQRNLAENHTFRHRAQHILYLLQEEKEDH
jgi:spore maturation protein CgeB